MQQIQPQPSLSVYISNESFKASFQSNAAPQSVVSSLKALRNNTVFVYMTNGEYIVYSMLSKAVLKQGLIEQNVLDFFLIDDREQILVAYFSTEHKQLRVLDLKNAQLLENFAPNFPSSLAITKQQRNDQNTARLLNDSKLYSLPGQESQTCYYLVVREQQSSASTDFGVVYSVFQLPKDLQTLTPDHSSNPQLFEYPNLTEQRDIFGSIIDEDTVVFFGQDYEPGKYEFLLMQPKLGQHFVSTIYIPEPLSFTLQDITPWSGKGRLAIWFNNNDSTAQPCIDVLDFESFLGQQNTSVPTLKKLYNPTRIPNECPGDVIIHQINYVGQDFLILEKSLGSKKYLQLVEIDTRRVLYQMATPNGSKRIETASDGSYFLVFEPQIMNPGQSIQEVYLQASFVHNYKLYLIKLMHQSKLLDNYPNISIVPELFELLFD